MFLPRGRWPTAQGALDPPLSLYPVKSLGTRDSVLTPVSLVPRRPEDIIGDFSLRGFGLSHLYNDLNPDGYGF